jgi:KipI family sensor histidine kinase inhibitor
VVAAARVRLPSVVPIREDAVLLEWTGASDDEANRWAVALGRRLRGSSERGLLDAIPGARTLLLVFDNSALDREALSRRVMAGGSLAGEAVPPSRLLRFPVLYDGQDLAELAGERGLAPEELARRHAAARYRVAFVGFAPGFGYLAGLPPELAAPRLSTPRARVPAGSVAIGGAWTGIYPADSPGGWRLIGRTSARLFDAGADPPSLLAPGDEVEFERVARLPPPPSPATRAGAPSRPSLRVLSPALFTTIQGAPRYGLGSSGVAPGGAMDRASLARANALSGNAAGAAALESALTGPELEVLADAVVAISGGEAAVFRNDSPAPFDEPFAAAAGDRIRIGRVTRGARVYLALRGGIEGGGAPGARIAAGEVLGAGTCGPHVGLPPRTACSDEILLRVFPGPESDWFEPAQRGLFLATPWRVTAESDRRGLRLAGPPLAHAGASEIAPSGTVPGTIQVPGSGLPIILGPDGPVTGGYPRLATVLAADLSLLGQVRPGAVVRFEVVSEQRPSSPGGTITFP